MITILHSGAAGMRGQVIQTDVIAHNISNINTTGYKGKSVNYADLIYQDKVPRGTPVAPEPPTGLMPQAGRGSRVNSISMNMGTGYYLYTGHPLDIAIEGEGFIGIELPDGTMAYTKSGALGLDSDRRMLTIRGNIISGELELVPEEADVQTLFIDTGGEVSVTLPEEQVALRLGEGLFFGLDLGDGTTGYTSQLSFNLGPGGQLETARGEALLGELDPVPEGVRLEDLRVGPGGEVGYLDGAGDLVPLGSLNVYRFPDPGRTEPRGGSMRMETAASGPPEPVDVVALGPGETLGLVQEEMKTHMVEVGLGSISLFSFPNPKGLAVVGDNMLAESEASGEAVEGVPGEGELGVIRQGVLEGSNVYLPEEMSRLILSQRYFQLNSRSVRFGDEMWALANTLKR